MIEYSEDIYDMEEEKKEEKLHAYICPNCLDLRFCEFEIRVFSTYDSFGDIRAWHYIGKEIITECHFCYVLFKSIENSVNNELFKCESSELRTYFTLLKLFNKYVLKDPILPPEKRVSPENIFPKNNHWVPKELFFNRH